MQREAYTRGAAFGRPEAAGKGVAQAGRSRGRTYVALIAAAALLAALLNTQGASRKPRSPPGLPHPSSSIAALKRASSEPASNCARLLWISALQHEEGDDDRSVQYVTAATSHLRYYAAALRSAREAAPALIPVLVALGDLPTEFVRWAEREGAMVVDHTLSFADQVEASSSLKGRPARRLVGSYTGLDLPAIMQKVEAKLPAYERRWMRNWLGLRGSMPGVPTMIDAEHVLWTDPDVLFRQPVDTCTLPAAHLMSLGAAKRPGSILDSSIMAVNVDAYAAMQPALLKFAEAQKWQFEHGQSLLEQFLYSSQAAEWREPWHMPTPLPDLYSYKAYWGDPEPGWMGMFSHQTVEPVIVHTQGIKAERSLCVIEWLGKSIKGAQKLEWEPAKVLKSRGDIVRHCGLPKGSSTLDEMLRLAAGAFKADNGNMFLRVRYEQDRLCPKACWLPAVKRSRKKVTKEVEMEGADLSAVADGEIGAGAEGDDSDA